jgi:hypothetical protein
MKEHNIIRHDVNDGKIYDKCVGKLREEKFEKLKKNLSHQTKFIDNIRRENIDSEKIARASKSFTDGELIKECTRIVSAVEVICPENE